MSGVDQQENKGAKDSSASALVPCHRIAIQDVSAWILRLGVMASILVMLLGIIISFTRHPVPVQRMQTAKFDYQPSVLWQGLRELRGKAIIEIGIYLLVLTPILRVGASVVLFAVEERDWLYALITLMVLLLTLAGLFIMK